MINGTTTVMMEMLFVPKMGETLINGQIVYLYSNGRQAKGELVLDNGVLRYYDPDSGAQVVNTSLTINGMTYNFDENGIGKDAPNLTATIAMNRVTGIIRMQAEKPYRFPNH